MTITELQHVSELIGKDAQRKVRLSPERVTELEEVSMRGRRRRGIILTPELAYAAGRDAGCLNMRKHGRERWNEDDWNVAAKVTNRLLDACGVPNK